MVSRIRSLFFLSLSVYVPHVDHGFPLRVPRCACLPTFQNSEITLSSLQQLMHHSRSALNAEGVEVHECETVKNKHDVNRIAADTKLRMEVLPEAANIYSLEKKSRMKRKDKGLSLPC